MIKRILVPVDGSEHALNAVKFAARLARQSGAAVHLFHVAKRAGIPQDVGAFIQSEGLKEPPQTVYRNFVAEHIVGAAEEEAKREGLQEVVTDVVSGDPAEEILEYAKGRHADMIVLGVREMGSVAGKVCAESFKPCVILRKGLLEGKKVLLVDDETDVLETLEELLDMCKVEKATNFDDAKALLEKQRFDLAVLDIMGVDGYGLLEIANKRKVKGVMLTAHALSPEDTVKSYKAGAASYVPKDKMNEIVTYLGDVLEAAEKGKHPWWRWFERFGAYYERRFGSELKNGFKGT